MSIRCSEPSSSTRHSSTRSATSENRAKLVPAPSNVAPSGYGLPGQISMTPQLHVPPGVDRCGGLDGSFWPYDALAPLDALHSRVSGWSASPLIGGQRTVDDRLGGPPADRQGGGEHAPRAGGPG